MWASGLVDDPARHPAAHVALEQISRRLRSQTLCLEAVLRETGLREVKEQALPRGLRSPAASLVLGARAGAGARGGLAAAAAPGTRR